MQEPKQELRPQQPADSIHKTARGNSKPGGGPRINNKKSKKGESAISDATQPSH